MPRRKADITGLMVKAKPGWEKRAKELAKPEYFSFNVGVGSKVREGLTPSENKRLNKKLNLVVGAAAYMAAGMVKGTVKYDRDDLDVDTWMAHVVGELSDEMNYVMLLSDAYFRLKKKSNS